jgi:dipeptidyl-peptidase-4
VRTRTAALSSLLFPVLALPLSAQETLTLELASGRGKAPSYRGKTEAWRWADDGVHLIRGSGDDKVWIDPATWSEVDPVEAPEPAADEKSEREAKRDQLRAAFAAVTGVSEKRAKSLASRRVDETEDGSISVHADKGELWIFRKGEGARQLLAAEAGAQTELEELSPDGNWLAYVSGGDLHVDSTGDGRHTVCLSDGDDETFNGKLDWVYQEEVYGRGNFKAFWWSPDSAHIAFLSLDESPVHEFTVVDHIEKGHFRVTPEVSNYPKAGDPNPTVRLGVVAAGGGPVTWVDLAKYADDEPLVVRVGWSPLSDNASGSTRVIFQVQDRIQTWLDLNAANPETGQLQTLIHERSDSWVNVLGSPRWLADGTFLWSSERTGWNHLYHYRPDGELIRAVTAGEWAVGRVRHTDEERGTLWFDSTADGAVDGNLYRVGLDGTGLSRLTEGRGSHSTTFNGDRSLFLDRVSSLASPGEVRLCSGDGATIKVLAETDVTAYEEKYASSRWELHEVATRDGLALDVALLKPVPFDPAASYAVWIPTYSGPNAPSVRNRWNSSLWYQFLAQNGVVVMQVNVRSASGKGQWSTATAYKQLLVQELADLEDAVAWVTANPWADAERVGITGYSYGGSMSAYALTHSKGFALGIAGGGVYDWRMYDTIYTERYMSTPQLNEEGYDKTSVLPAAKDLSGHLLLHAGVMDDNVHMQNTLQLAYALQKANKDFELMLYPQNRHGIRDGDQRWFSRRMEWNAIREHLLGLEPMDPPIPEAKPVEAAGP